jgi:Fe-S-cluster-containing dehydrogenase component
VGCGNCQRSCNEANGLQPTPEQAQGLSIQTYTYVQPVSLGNDKLRYVKRQCMHCLDAACASACPTSAMWRTPEGPVAWRGERCLGCRYCMVSCPFGVPRYEWQNGLSPQVRKCMFCIQRQRSGQEPACTANCPSGALKFGSRADLLKDAYARIAAHPDVYVNHVFGEHEAGGTAWLYISDVPFEQLGFRTSVTTQAVPSYTWQVMEKIPFVAGGLAVVLTGVSAWTRRRGGHHDEPEWLREEK